MFTACGETQSHVRDEVRNNTDLKLYRGPFLKRPDTFSSPQLKDQNLYNVGVVVSPHISPILPPCPQTSKANLKNNPLKPTKLNQQGLVTDSS